MRISRIYHPDPLTTGQEVELTSEASHHLAKVLRAKGGEAIVLFNGDGYNYPASISQVSKKHVSAKIHDKTPNATESNLKIELAQVISRGDKMELTIQKAVELGVTHITPLLSERCGVKLSSERFAKKRQQWQKIVQSACEQCGRSIVPKIGDITQLEDLFKQNFDGLKLNLHPQANAGIANLKVPENGKIQLLIGPEGGLSEHEIQLAHASGYQDILMGPRILRTETAGLAAISMLQCVLGDMN
ncbi:16S rRNA (uracil(1498)-N(3))-methyltransferase [Gayadomonas joobiniege]|uniref:16S rRNA (uracil(1498)-N(3))-methyltransferase n=1 Tax=Gayadomonas joobiniege TaxID=1234606 RepID=UPI00036B34E1|nr:16S rRNA (uracil(1498)-N(3))-methyltransferase [Gayadomonas joobiniege]